MPVLPPLDRAVNTDAVNTDAVPHDRPVSEPTTEWPSSVTIILRPGRAAAFPAALPVAIEEGRVSVLGTERSDSPAGQTAPPPSPKSRWNAICRGWRFSARWDPVALTIGAAALLLGAVFVVTDLAYNRGKLIAPLDDVYIHLQYGSQLGRGYFFQYNTGDPISTGASSLLYVVVLGLAYTSGFRDNLLLPFAVSFGILCFALTASCVYALGRRLVDKSVGVWSGLLVAVSGPLLWGATSGMEVGLVALLVVASLLFFTKEMPLGRFLLTPILAALLALARPEGLIFATALSGAMCWTIFAPVRHRSSTRAGGLSGAAWSLLPLVAGLGQLFFYRWATGTMAANGVQSKSFLYDHPVLYLGEFIDRTMWNFRGFLDVFGGLSTRDFTFPGAVFFVVLGVFYLVTKRALWRPLIIATTVSLIAVLISVSTLVTAHAQNLRYVQPFMPIFGLLSVVGAYGLMDVGGWGDAGRIERSRRTVAVAHAVLAMVLVFSLSSLPTWALRLGQEAATIRETDISVAHWISGNLPPGATVGVKDVGAVKYFSNHRVVDVIGLTTNHMAQASNNGIGTLYEALRHMPARERPDYFAFYDTTPGPLIDDLRDSGVLGSSPLMTFDVESPSPANSGLIVPFVQLGIYRADWSLAGTGDQTKTPGTVRDYLNVGDLASEGAHSYAPQLALVGMQPMSVVRRVSLPDGRLVLDSGRRIVGGERFVAHNLVPGRPLLITSRADVGDTPRGDQIMVLPDLLVLAHGVPVGRWHRPPGGTIWNESSFTIPGALVTGPSLALELAAPRQLLSPYPDYISFGYWFSQ